MKKTILITIAFICLASSCNSIPKSIRNALTYCHEDRYTGIDTLINIEGYYSPLMMFYENGLVVRWGYSGYLFDNNKSSFLKEVAINPEVKDSKSFYDEINCGGYVICGDTIKVQMIHKEGSINDPWHAIEDWYLIVDKNTLHCINRFFISTNKKERERLKDFVRTGPDNTITPLPAKPQLDYYWILKEKWFWCNEQAWKAYMEKIKKKR